MKITDDYYLIIDFEASCADDKSIPPASMEIIEIGAVMLNSKTLKIESEYDTFVKPIIHPKLTNFCQSLTSITQQDIDNAPIFPDALQDFLSWLNPYKNYLFCSWGNYDQKQLKQDCELHNLNYPFSVHVNLKKEFSVAMKSKKQWGMARALKMLNLPLEGTHHRGIDDARNIARIVQTIVLS